MTINPKPIRITDNNGNTIAKAYWKKKPNKQGLYAWRMKIIGKSKRIELGRLKECDVEKEMHRLFKSQKKVLSKKDIKLMKDALGMALAIKKSKVLKQNTYRNYKDAFRRLTKAIGELPIYKINDTLLGNLKEELCSEYKDSTVKSTFGFLNFTLKTCYEKGIIKTLYCYRFLKVAKKTTYIPTDDEVISVFDALPNGQIKVLFLLIWKIGMRKGETLSTTWADIIYDEKHRCYILPLDGKTGKRSIPLSYETHEMMVKLSPTTNGNLIEKTAYNQINRTIIEVCNELNIKSFTPKDLRTKRANELAIELPSEAYMEWMGHSYTTYMKHYKRSNKEQIFKSLVKNAA